MDRLESGASGGVIVFDMERFSRKPKEGERLIDAAERGLVVLDSDGEFDLTTASGKKADSLALVPNVDSSTRQQASSARRGFMTSPESTGRASRQFESLTWKSAVIRSKC
jgi:hypothetical protein